VRAAPAEVGVDGAEDVVRPPGERAGQRQHQVAPPRRGKAAVGLVGGRKGVEGGTGGGHGILRSR
jgi:hypothetical protein